MRKTLIIIPFLTLMIIGCKKDDWVAHPNRVGKHFKTLTRITTTLILSQLIHL